MPPLGLHLERRASPGTRDNRVIKPGDARRPSPRPPTGFAGNTALFPIRFGFRLLVPTRPGGLVIRRRHGKVSTVLPTCNVADGNPRQNLMVLPDLWPVSEIPLALCL